MSVTKYIPDTITSMNLLCGVLGVIFTLDGRPDVGFLFMIGAAVADFFDGLPQGYCMLIRIWASSWTRCLIW